MSAFPHHAEAVETLNAPAGRLFDFLDDQHNLSSHMREPSPLMLGSHMEIHIDESGARSVGSRFGFSGAVLGIPLRVDEIVTVRKLPRRKVWETVGEPCLWVIGRYRMGFEIAPLERGTRLLVQIDYQLPELGLPHLLGQLFGRFYAAWCTIRMVRDAKRHFAQLGPGPITSTA